MGTRRGDIVCIVFGAQIPFVLREVAKVHLTRYGKHYRLVGECYVHGILCGEALELEIRPELYEVI